MEHDQEDAELIRYSTLEFCDHCGSCDVIVPTIDEQMQTILDNIDFERIRLAERPVFEFPKLYKEKSIGEMREELKQMMEDVVARVRETCNTGQVCGCGGWYVWIDNGVINVRWSVEEWGWQP